MNEQEMAYYIKELSKLVGWTVAQPVQDQEGEFFGLYLTKAGTPKGRILWIQQDDEGNGPGSFEIQKL